MLTPYGKAIRKLRIERSMTLKEFADTLETTPAYLSAMEHGRKNIPSNLVQRVAAALELDESDANSLRRAAANSKMSVRIEMARPSAEVSEFAQAFSRKFADGKLDSAKIAKMWIAMEDDL
jgi:transcriptional regulator with XRE-family HTH domain